MTISGRMVEEGTMNKAFFEMIKNEHDPVYARVVEQINRISSIDKVEAFHLCLAHSRCLAQLLASTSDTDEEFVKSLRSMFPLLLNEGLARRRESAMGMKT
jgi:uncharacterized protein YjaZ